MDRRSLYPLLAKPLSRSEFFLGKFLGLGFTLLVNITVMFGGLALTLLATGKAVEASLVKAVIPIYLGLLLVVALALLFSTFTSAALATVGTNRRTYRGRPYADVIRNFKDVAPAAPDWLLDAVYYALPNFEELHFKARVVYR